MIDSGFDDKNSWLSVGPHFKILLSKLSDFSFLFIYLLVW